MADPGGVHFHEYFSRFWATEIDLYDFQWFLGLKGHCSARLHDASGIIPPSITTVSQQKNTVHTTLQPFSSLPDLPRNDVHHNHTDGSNQSPSAM
jgi:hypothetical protein